MPRHIANPTYGDAFPVAVNDLIQNTGRFFVLIPANWVSKVILSPKQTLTRGFNYKVMRELMSKIGAGKRADRCRGVDPWVS